MSDEIVFNSAITHDTTSIPLGDSHFIVSYRDVSNSHYGTSRVGFFTGDSIEWMSDEIVFNSAITDNISSTILGDSYFAISYRDYDNSNYGTSRVGFFTGDSIKWISKIVFNSAETDYISSTFLVNNNLVVSYRDYGNSYYGTSVVYSFNSYVGIAEGSVSLGDSFILQFGGKVNGFSNLTPGATYYVNYDTGTISTSGTDKVGIAVGDTELILN